MDRKRWLALIVVVVLFFMSIGFRFATSVASGFLTNMTSLIEEDLLQEQIIEEGSMTSKVAVLHLDGVIQDLDASLLNTSTYNHKQFLKQIDKVAEDPFIDAVVLYVNSPGGGVVESAQIHDRLKKLKEQYDKPFYVSMGGMAASGGYYVSAPADKIYAEPATLTGSIGVIMQNINFGKFAEKHGVEFNTITSGKHKDILSSTREMTEEERNILQSMIDEMYDDFVGVIVDGRNMDEKTVRKLADGRVYTGKQAKEVELIDEIGSLEDTIAAIKEENNLQNAQVIQYEYGLGIFNFFGLTVNSLFNDRNGQLADILTLMNYSDSPRAMYLYTN